MQMVVEKFHKTSPSKTQDTQDYALRSPSSSLRIHRVISDLLPLEYGIPQGSIQGRLLHSVFSLPSSYLNRKMKSISVLS